MMLTEYRGLTGQGKAGWLNVVAVGTPHTHTDCAHPAVGIADAELMQPRWKGSVFFQRPTAPECGQTPYSPEPEHLDPALRSFNPRDVSGPQFHSPHNLTGSSPKSTRQKSASTSRPWGWMLLGVISGAAQRFRNLHSMAEVALRGA